MVKLATGLYVLPVMASFMIIDQRGVFENRGKGRNHLHMLVDLERVFRGVYATEGLASQALQEMREDLLTTTVE